MFVCCANNGAADLSMLESMHASAAGSTTVQDCRQQAGRCSDRVDAASVCACVCVCVRAVVCACVLACVCHVRARVSCLRVLYACAMNAQRANAVAELSTRNANRPSRQLPRARAQCRARKVHASLDAPCGHFTRGTTYQRERRRGRSHVSGMKLPTGARSVNR